MKNLLYPILISAGLALPASAAIISADGSLYTSVVGSPAAGGGDFDVTNLFDQPTLAIGDDPGSGADSGRSWAAANPAAPNATQGPRFRFQLDQLYTITDMVYGQRQFNENQGRDKNTTARIWASATDVFTTLTTPAGAADATIALNSTTAGDTFTNYALGTPIVGQYFYIEFDEAGNSGNNDTTGGSEFRFQGVAVPEPSSALLLGLGGLALLRRRR